MDDEVQPVRLHIADRNVPATLSKGRPQAADILKELKVPPPHAVLIVIGGASAMEPEKKELLKALYVRGIARAAELTGATLITGGTKAGVMEMIGEGVKGVHSANPDALTLIGVSPEGKVLYEGKDEVPPPEKRDDYCALEPNHTHFVLVETEDWGGETQTMFNLAKTLGWATRERPVKRTSSAELLKNVDMSALQLSESPPTSSPEAARRELFRPQEQVLTLLSNGGGLSKIEAWHSVRQGWPLIVLKGSGRLADQIVGLVESGVDPNTIEDEKLRCIVKSNLVHIFSLEEGIEALERLIRSMFPLADKATGESTQVSMETLCSVM